MSENAPAVPRPFNSRHQTHPLHILHSVTIKGGAGDDAVLCTDSSTFALKLVETTNTLLLLPPDAAGDADFECAPSPAPPADAAAPRDVGLQTQLQKAAAADGAPPLIAAATAAAHIEVVRALPRLARLRELLRAARPYGLEDEKRRGGGGDDGGGDDDAMDADNGDDDDDEPRWRRRLLAGGGAAAAAAAPPPGYTTRELLSRVQASRAELLAELKALDALCLGGRWRLVEEDYLGGLLEALLLTATEHGWPLEAVPLSEAAAALAPDGYEAALVRHCLRVHGRPAAGDAGDRSGSGSGSGQEAGDGSGKGQEGQGQRAEDEAAAGVYELDRRRVCLHFARKLLRQRGARSAGCDASGGAWRRGEFMAAWAAAVPEEWSPPDAAWLAGEALEDAAAGAAPGDEPVVAPFAARALPLDPSARFEALFRRRPRWERAALEPYLAPLVAAGGGHTIESLLLRHARASQASPDAPVLFSAR